MGGRLPYGQPTRRVWVLSAEHRPVVRQPLTVEGTVAPEKLQDAPAICSPSLRLDESKYAEIRLDRSPCLEKALFFLGGPAET